MNKLLTAVIILFVFTQFVCHVYSQDFTSLGEKLEKELFETAKNKDWTKLEGLIANGFQSMHADGPKSRTVAIEYIKSITFKYYHFSDIVVTNNDAKDIIIITYKLSFSENIDMTEEEKGKYVNNLSVWQGSGDSWQWISHSVFDGKVK